MCMRTNIRGYKAMMHHRSMVDATVAAVVCILPFPSLPPLLHVHGLACGTSSAATYTSGVYPAAVASFFSTSTISIVKPVVEPILRPRNFYTIHRHAGNNNTDNTWNKQQHGAHTHAHAHAHARATRESISDRLTSSLTVSTAPVIICV